MVLVINLGSYSHLSWIQMLCWMLLVCFCRLLCTRSICRVTTWSPCGFCSANVNSDFMQNFIYSISVFRRSFWRNHLSLKDADGSEHLHVISPFCICQGVCCCCCENKFTVIFWNIWKNSWACLIIKAFLNRCMQLIAKLSWVPFTKNMLALSIKHLLAQKSIQSSVSEHSIDALQISIYFSSIKYTSANESCSYGCSIPCGMCYFLVKSLLLLFFFSRISCILPAMLSRKADPICQ